MLPAVTDSRARSAQPSRNELPETGGSIGGKTRARLGSGERTVMEDSAMTEWRCDDGRRKIAYRPIARQHDVLASSDSSSVANAKFRSDEMSKLTRSIEDAQCAMTNVLSVTALTLSGLLVLVLAERYL
jgi:hypothetical protein